MRILILFLVIILSTNIVFAKKNEAMLTSPQQGQIEIDQEFVTDFVGYDEKEFKAFQKAQEKQAKFDKKRAKLEQKKAKLELKKKKSLQNQEYCVKYIEKLKSTEVQESNVNEAL